MTDHTSGAAADHAVETDRARSLIVAERKAERLFAEVTGRGLVAPGRSEKALYAHVVGLAEASGWEFGGPHSGHLVGEFPHETIDGEQIESYIAPGSDHPMRRLDRVGRNCHWILEVHLVDRERGIGGFFEQLLTLNGAATG